jgi:hypothetical protein
MATYLIGLSSTIDPAGFGLSFTIFLRPYGGCFGYACSLSKRARGLPQRGHITDSSGAGT